MIVSKEVKHLGRVKLDTLCGEWFAHFKRPKHYLLIFKLLKNGYGKVVNTKLRPMLSGASGHLTALK